MSLQRELTYLRRRSRPPPPPPKPLRSRNPPPPPRPPRLWPLDISTLTRFWKCAYEMDHFFSIDISSFSPRKLECRPFRGRNPLHLVYLRIQQKRSREDFLPPKHSSRARTWRKRPPTRTWRRYCPSCRCKPCTRRPSHVADPTFRFIKPAKVKS